MRSKATIGIVLVAVVLVGLPLACKAKPGTAGQSAPDNVVAELEKRLDLMKSNGPNVSLTILPVRIGAIEKAEDAATASDLARMINEAGLCKAAPAKQSLLLKASMNDPNEMNKLWALAREFRDYAKKNPSDADYVLYADYIFTPNWDFVMVHFVVCDRQGEWVIVDLQNSHHPDYQSINPKSKEDCNRLVVKRLEGYLR